MTTEPDKYEHVKKSTLADIENLEEEMQVYRLAASMAVYQCDLPGYKKRIKKLRRLIQMASQNENDLCSIDSEVNVLDTYCHDLELIVNAVC